MIGTFPATMQLFSEVDITALLIFFLVWMLTYICFRKPAGIPPGPLLTIPVLGDLPQFAVAKGDVIGTLRKLRKKHGNIYSIYMGRQLAIIVNGYGMIHNVAAQAGLQFCGRPQTFWTEVTSKGMGLAMSTGNTWKQQRYFASKAFLKLGMKSKSYEKHIIKEVEALTEVLEKQEGHPFDMKKYIHTSAANVVVTSICGKRDNMEPLIQSFIQLFDNKIRMVQRVSILMNCLPLLKYIPRDPFKLVTLQKEFQTFKKLVKEHIVEPILKTPPKEPTTFVEMYIENIKDHEQKDEETVFTFDQMTVVLSDIIGGGSETVPVSLRWAVLYLVNFPDIQKRLQQHIDEAIPTARLPCLDDKFKLPFVEAFIAEVLRCANILPLGGPRSDIDGNDAYLEGYLIPKDAAIMFDYDSIFMDPDIFEHPETFNPDRFLDASGEFVAPKEFVPFSIGRRHCIGMQLAKWELFLDDLGKDVYFSTG